MKTLATTLLIALPAACSSHEAECTGPSTVSKEPRPPAAIQQQGWVTDQADILSLDQERSLSNELAAYQRRTQHQLVIVTVRSLKGRDETAFTRDLANAWGIGRDCHNDGITFLVATKERRVRIAVGYGLEGTLTNAVAARILQERVLPRFTREDLSGGIEEGAQSIMKAAS